MPLLSKHVKSHLLSNFDGKPNASALHNASKGHKPLPDPHPDADPITSSDSESDEIHRLPDDQSGSDLEHRPGTEEGGKLPIPGNSKKSQSQPTNISTPLDTCNVEEGPRTGNKRKRDPTSTNVSSKENDAVFDELYHATKNKRNKKQYGGRKLYPSTSNMHTTSEERSASHSTPKESNKSFKNPDDAFGSSAQTGKRGFHVPNPLQDVNKKSISKATFEAPASSPSSPSFVKLAFSKIHCSSDPFDVSSSVLSASPDSEMLKSTQEIYDIQTSRLESLNSPPASPGSSLSDRSIAVCPMCKTEVDPAFLESFSKGKALRLTAAMDFCLAHKQRSAQTQLSTFPSIDWTQLDRRLRNYNGQMLAILEQRTPSVYRQELEERVASGRSRNALRNPEAEGLQSLRGLTGYYGAKGARMMMEHIMAKFAGKIRVLAAKDKLFTEVGVSGFVQAVLVPELVLLLVMEDLGLRDKDQARGIVSESAEMGDLVNEEHEDWVDVKAHNDPDLTKEGKASKASKAKSKTRSADASFIVIE